MNGEGPIRDVAKLLRSWPEWLLIACFLTLAVVFALAGVLDDWLRAACAVVFVAVALALFARWRRE